MAYQQFVDVPIGEVVIGGGGSRNPALMGMLAAHLDPVPVVTHEALGIDSDYKEALVFAVLAYETWHNRPATLPSLTGASHASVLGQITPGTNYEQLIRATWR
jgi:anhydro-N-acetylmuramic acid kinase